MFRSAIIANVPARRLFRFASMLHSPVRLTFRSASIIGVTARPMFQFAPIHNIPGRFDVWFRSDAIIDVLVR